MTIRFGTRTQSFHRVRVILDALADDDWMTYIREWRDSRLDSEPVTDPCDFYRVTSAPIPSPPLDDAHGPFHTPMRVYAQRDAREGENAMANDTLRIGFVGAGGIVRDRHVPGLRKAPGVEFYGVVNRSRESSQRAAEEFGIERTYDDWQELVADPKVDIVWIGAHPYMHRVVTEAALEAGKHVFTQARMAHQLRGCQGDVRRPPSATQT